MELFPIHLFVLLLLLNRYVLGSTLRRMKGERFDETRSDYEPPVAIVVPLFNEGEGIYRTVLSLLEQEYPKEKLEIVVVDDRSTDDSLAWARRAAEDRPGVRVIESPVNRGKRQAINLGVRSTTAEIVVSVDSDVLVDRRAVRQLVARFVSDRIAAVGGRTFVVNRGDNWLTKMIEVKFYFAQEWLKDLERVFRTVMCLSGCLTAYRRSVLLELEPILERRSILGVPIKYGEDRFLTRQIVKAGYQTVYTTAAYCETAAPRNLSGYFSQQLRWRRSNLVDLLSGMTHAWRLHPVVTLHYLLLLAVLLAYPAVIVHGLLTGELFPVIVRHLGLVGLLGVVYWWDTRSLPAERRVPPWAFLPIAVLMPATYLMFTPLALFTLDSGSWETRGGSQTAADANPDADVALPGAKSA